MSDYTQITDFSAKDTLISGDPNKLIKGSDFDAEFAAISTAIASKYDSSDIATPAEAQDETLDTKLITPSKLGSWSDANAGIVGDLHALTDPNADRLLFWDDSASAATFLTVGTGLSLSGTTLTTNDAAINHDSLSGFVANKHIDHSAVSINAGNGLTGGGTINASRTLDVGAGTGISVSADAVALDTANSRNVDHAAVVITAGSGLTGGGAINASRTINVGAGTGISVSADAVALDTGDSHNVDHAAVNIIAGGGLVGGGTITNSRTITLGTPSSIGLSTPSQTTADSHTHELIGSGLLRTHTGFGGVVTVSTSDASGSATNGDLWLKV